MMHKKTALVITDSRFHKCLLLFKKIYHGTDHDGFTHATG